MKRWTAFLLCLASTIAADPLTWTDQQSGCSATIDISSDTVVAGEELRVTLDVILPPETSLNLDQLRSQLVDRGDQPFELISERVSTPADRRTEVSYVLRSWTTGLTPLSFITISCSGPDGVTDLFPTVFQISVTPPKPQDSSSLTAPLLSIPPTSDSGLNDENRQTLLDAPGRHRREADRNEEIFASRETPWKLLGVLVVLAVVFWIAIRLRKGFQATKDGSLSLDPTVRALRRLEALKQKNLPEIGEYDLYYVELTDIVRQFTEENYQLHAPEETTEEFLRELEASGTFDSQTQSHLSTFLQEADLVKFARLSPTLADCTAAEDAAHVFIILAITPTEEASSH